MQHTPTPGKTKKNPSSKVFPHVPDREPAEPRWIWAASSNARWTGAESIQILVSIEVRFGRTSGFPTTMKLIFGGARKEHPDSRSRGRRGAIKPAASDPRQGKRANERTNKTILFDDFQAETPLCPMVSNLFLHDSIPRSSQDSFPASVVHHRPSTPASKRLDLVLVPSPFIRHRRPCLSNRAFGCPGESLGRTTLSR